MTLQTDMALKVETINAIFVSTVSTKMGAFHSTKISGNSGPKLNGTVLTNREIFGKEGPPFEVDRFFGRSVLIGNYCSIRKKFGLQYLSVVNFWKFPSETE